MNYAHIKKCSLFDFISILKLKNIVVKNMQNKDLFYPSSSLDMLLYLIKKENSIYGIYNYNKLVAYSTVCYNKKDGRYTIEDTLVFDRYRGRGYQMRMWQYIINVLPFDCEIFCTIHPKNIYSLQNALAIGFKIISIKNLYNNSPRYILKYHKII